MQKKTVGPGVVVIVIGLLLVGGCRRGRVVDVREKWLINQSASTVTPRVSIPTQSYLLLDDNGKFVALKLPGLVETHFEKNSIVSGIGNWNLVSEGEQTLVQLTFTKIDKDGIPLPYGVYLTTVDTEGKHLLRYEVGDINDHEGVMLERSQP